MFNPKLFLILFTWIYCISSKSQTISCNSNVIYLHTSAAACGTCANTPIKVFDPTLPLSATNPSNLVVPSGGSGLAFGNNLNSSTPNPTFYTIIGNSVNWWNGSAWVNTGHTFPNTAVNLGLAGNVLYGIGGTGSGNTIYTYSGTANSNSLINIPNFSPSNAIGDVVGDCNGNFYILTTSPGLLRIFDGTGTLISTYTLTGLPATSGGAFSIVNGNVYCAISNTLYIGVVSGLVINFSVATCFSPFGLWGDFAQCPSCNLLTPVPSTSINCSVILPVELLEFKLTKGGAGVIIEWTTATEHKSKKFEIERSLDADTWENVSSVKAAGFSTQLLNYKAIDTSPLSGISYYRLKEVDMNGEVSFSEIRWISFEDEKLLRVWPVPANDKLLISTLSAQRISEVKINNALGCIISYKKSQDDDGVVEINTGDLISGYYTVEIRTEMQEVIYKKILINN